MNAKLETVYGNLSRRWEAIGQDARDILREQVAAWFTDFGIPLTSANIDAAVTGFSMSFKWWAEAGTEFGKKGGRWVMATREGTELLMAAIASFRSP